MSIKRLNSTVFIRLILFAVAVATLYPVLFIVFTSLKTTDEFYGALWSIPSRFTAPEVRQRSFKFGRASRAAEN